MRHCWTVLGRIPARLGWLILHVGPVGSGRAFGPLSFWFVWQWLTTRYYGLQSVRPGSLLKYCLRTYKGPPLALADGTPVRPGDRIVELHLDNAAFVARLANVEDLDRVTEWTWALARAVADDLAALAAPGRLSSEVIAVRGTTLLASGARRLGFELRVLPSSHWNDLTRFFMLGLLAIYSHNGRRRLALAKKDAYPTETWMGRRALLGRYQRT